MSYATPQQMLQRFDSRILGDLVSDDGSPVDAEFLLEDDVLQAHLDDATGMISAALLYGDRYSLDDLSSLSEVSESLLVRMCCDIAMALLLRRRPSRDPDKDAARLELAEKHLQKLQSGEEVFSVEGRETAGTPELTGPTVVSLDRMQMLRDRVQNYYPRRPNR